MLMPRLVGLTLVAAVLTLAPVAHASLPEQSWMPGLYDSAEFDDVILLVTDNVGVVDPNVVGSARPVCVVVGLVMRLRAGSPPSSLLSPVRGRAPPATVSKPSLLDPRQTIRARHFQPAYREASRRRSCSGEHHLSADPLSKRTL